MATTVNGAFGFFMKDVVDLDRLHVKKARSSRDWLLEQVHALPDSDDQFPLLSPEFDIQFGSFARKTKIRPLDDIDLMIGLHAQGASYAGHGEGVEISVPESAITLRPFCSEDNGYLSSRRVVNAFVAALREVPQYEHAELKRNREAATLSLSSYPWVYDIVPCFFTKPDVRERTYYLIPDGSGSWKMTDPRMDRARVRSLTTSLSGRLLSAIRVAKYWNRHKKTHTVYPYLMENLLLSCYGADQPELSQFMDVELSRCLAYIRDNIGAAVVDPKDLQGDLNTISTADRVAIAERASYDYEQSVEAAKYERDGNHRAAIGIWRSILGDEFPTFSE